ncbi:MAG: alpha/beta fold hydrolase [Methylobacteriaceae bacterium]|nr:alpha/beta fold hydrolase [Methylobacteriaceae bacterium]MBV9701369.1 alpha/beta fold hydrolase [Methylobacteriaceae bacterium]
MSGQAASARMARISTSHGQIAVETAGEIGPVVLVVHGNSSCRGVFRKQMQSVIAKRARLIAFDLPGHGDSSDAPDPARSYRRSGLAAVAVEVLRALCIDRAIVFGGSLGGHIAIERPISFQACVD